MSKDKTADQWERPDVKETVRKGREVSQNGLKNATKKK